MVFLNNESNRNLKDASVMLSLLEGSSGNLNQVKYHPKESLYFATALLRHVLLLVVCYFTNLQSGSKVPDTLRGAFVVVPRLQHCYNWTQMIPVSDQENASAATEQESLLEFSEEVEKSQMDSSKDAPTISTITQKYPYLTNPN
jgi:hypothetical protein